MQTQEPPVREETRAPDRPAEARPLPVTRIRASKRWVPVDLRSVWEYRELLGFLIWRDIIVRYKQTALGVLWAIMGPVASMVIFSVVFGGLAKMPSDGVPYPIFNFAGLVPFGLFTRALNGCSLSLVASQQLVSKIYFPRLIIPIASVLGGLVDFAIAFVILLGMMLFYGITPGIAILTLPAFVLLALLTGLGVGLWFAAMNVHFRDVAHIVPFMVTAWTYASPIVYPVSLVPEKWRALYFLNPISGVVQGFRWALLGEGSPPWPMVLASALLVCVVLTGGLYYFRRMERSFADVV